MKRFMTAITSAIILTLCLALPAFAQEEAHYEGYFINSAHPATNPNPGVIGLEGRGLVTALAFFGSPLTSDFVTNEYTWVLKGLVPISSTLFGSMALFAGSTSADCRYAAEVTITR